MNRDRGCGRIQRLRRINGMWKYKGDLMPMIDNIRWTFVVNRMMRDDNDRLMNIMSDSDEMMKAAEEYGIH